MLIVSFPSGFQKMLSNHRHKSAQSIVELSAGIVIAIPVFLLILNAIAIALGLQSNENICREAARLAASGDPATAELRAQSIVSKANLAKGWMVADHRLVSIHNVANPMCVQQGTGSLPFSAVEVKTAIDINPILLKVLLYHERFLTFTTTQRFPYTYFAQTTPTNRAKTQDNSNN